MGSGPSKTRRVCIAVFVDAGEAGALLRVLARTNPAGHVSTSEPARSRRNDGVASSTTATKLRDPSLADLAVQRFAGFSRSVLFLAGALAVTLGATIGIRYALPPAQPGANAPPSASRQPRETAAADASVPVVASTCSPNMPLLDPPAPIETRITTTGVRSSDREADSVRPLKKPAARLTERTMPSSQADRVPASAPESAGRGRDDFIREL